MFEIIDPETDQPITATPAGNGSRSVPSAGSRPVAMVAAIVLGLAGVGALSAGQPDGPMEPPDPTHAAPLESTDIRPPRVSTWMPGGAGPAPFGVTDDEPDEPSLRQACEAGPAPFGECDDRPSD